MAVSADAQKLWLIVEQGDNTSNSVLLEIAAFDENGPFKQAPQLLTPNQSNPTQKHAGEEIFRTAFTAHSGLGPQFNANSCVTCHPGPGGASPREEHFARRLARMDPMSGRITPIDGKANHLAPRFSLPTVGEHGSTPLLRQANVISMRMPLSLFSVGKIDDIPDAVIEAQAVSKGDGIKGRVHYITEPGTSRRVGRYGWKADVATLEDMVAQAFLNEMGISSTLGQRAPPDAIEDDGTMVRSISAFLRTLRRPETTR